MRLVTAIGAMLLLPLAAVAHDYTISGLTVMHPVAYATPVTAQSGAGYFTITNTGDTPDRLLAVEAAFPRVMVHDTIIENDISKMVHLDGVDLPPGETVTLQPGGKHVMFMGLNGDPFEVGEAISATLVFENAGRLEVEFQVEDRPHDQGTGTMHGDDHTGEGTDHSGH